MVYEMERINDLAVRNWFCFMFYYLIVINGFHMDKLEKTQHAESSPPNPQPTETIDGRLLGSYADTQEPAHNIASVMDGRLPKKLRLDQEYG
jgi:hypothetical protein